MCSLWIPILGCNRCRFEQATKRVPRYTKYNKDNRQLHQIEIMVFDKKEREHEIRRCKKKEKVFSTLLHSISFKGQKWSWSFKSKWMKGEEVGTNAAKSFLCDDDRGHKFFLQFIKMGQPRPLFHLFLVFSLQFLQQIYVKKCPSSIRCRDSNPRPFGSWASSHNH